MLVNLERPAQPSEVEVEAARRSRCDYRSLAVERPLDGLDPEAVFPFPLATDFSSPANQATADLFIARGPTHHNLIHRHHTFCDRQLSWAWQSSGSKLWMVFGDQAEETRHGAPFTNDCCHTWMKSPMFPLPGENDADEGGLEDCWEVQLDAGDVFVFNSALAHFAYPLSPMASVIHHVVGLCHHEGGSTRPDWWPGGKREP